MAYFDDEKPVEFQTEKNVFRLYEKAGKLSCSRPKWVDKDGKEQWGKTVAVDLEALSEDEEAKAMFRKVVDYIFQDEVYWEDELEEE